MDDVTYSRVVSWLKIIFPILALGLLSTLFLVARTVDPAQQLPFAEIDVEEIARDERIGAPNYTGVTEEGAAISFSARTALPDPDRNRQMSGNDITAEIELPTGEHIDISAMAMELDTDAGTALLSDDVEISSDLGYVIRTSYLKIALDRTRILSERATTVSTAFGELSAGSFELSAQNDPSGTYRLVFKGGVKLLYGAER